MSIDTSRRDRTRLTMEPGDVFAATVRDMGGTEHHLHMIVWDPDHDGEGTALVTWATTPASSDAGRQDAMKPSSRPFLIQLWAGAGTEWLSVTPGYQAHGHKVSGRVGSYRAGDEAANGIAVMVDMYRKQVAS